MNDFLERLEAHIRNDKDVSVSIDVWHGLNIVIAGYSHLPHQEQLERWGESKGFSVTVEWPRGVIRFQCQPD